ncbi:MAG: hypothetical protein E4G95_03560, partial [Bacteroidia bacterium]
MGFGKGIIIFLLVSSGATAINAQGLFDSYSSGQKSTSWSLSGFARSGNYFGRDYSDNYHFTSSF